MVDAFNSMLGRLDDSFRRLSDFSSDVAHELRTPIANLTLHAQIVENPGPPIPPPQLARLFERFYRADSARQRDTGEGGAGLGLVIVKAIIDLHGGALWAESSEGVVRFVVRLPS